ncbi:hypothetical protein GCM10017771_95540 [Streptomyces capitiformicae]|uniref:HTH luxR-type domain-containing protein n=1 Tax=Streptomyces capitiformicae TaxID=2014920 RepID=A0A918ZWE2_9ACTN|nr:hypothetical protein GCM10017771_95540 [Streptomyces capitiformicae]
MSTRAYGSSCSPATAARPTYCGPWRRGRGGTSSRRTCPRNCSARCGAAAAGGLALAPEAAASVLGRAAEPPLSEREVDVVRLLAQGHSNRAIAAALFLAEATVKTHLVRIYRKLGAENRAAAVKEAVRLGLIGLV